MTLLPEMPTAFEASSVADFLSKLGDAKSNLGSDLVTFRGERKYEWHVLPSIRRPGMEGLLANEKNAIRDLIAVHPAEFSSDQSMFEKLVRMQHYGLPTRLIDVTANPLVALYFATERADDNADGKVSIIQVPLIKSKYYDSDAVSCLANICNLNADEKQEIIDKGLMTDIDLFNSQPSVVRLAQFIRAEKPYFTPHIRPVDLQTTVYVKPKLSNKRIIAQNGAFLITGLKFAISAEMTSSTINLGFIRIPNDAKRVIRNELDALGINRSFLFPEIEHAAGHILEKYL